MKIDFSFIASPVLVNDSRDHISGKIGTQNVEVFRRPAGWSAQLGIKVDDILVHLSEPNNDEKLQFNELQNRALNVKSATYDANRAKAVASNAFKKVFRNSKVEEDRPYDMPPGV